MSENQTTQTKKRQEYIVKLRKARENFLEIFFNENNSDAIPKNVDLLSILIVQNIEILAILRKIDVIGDN